MPASHTRYVWLAFLSPSEVAFCGTSLPAAAARFAWPLCRVLLQAELPRLVQLTKELSTSEDSLRGLCGQISGYHEATRATTASVAQRLSSFSSKLEERASLEARLEELRLLRRLAEVLSAVEGLLAAPPPSDAALDCYASSGGGGEGGEGGEGMPRPLLALLAEADTLCRAAESFGQLRLLARRAAEGAAEGGTEGGGAEAALVRRSGPRVDRARTLLVGRLQDCLGVSLEAGCAAPVRDCLRAAVEAGCVDEVYTWLRQEWVRPRLLPQLQQAAADVRERALPAIVATCLAFARSEAFAPLLQPELALTKPALHVLTQSLWVEVATFLTSSTPQFFGAGIPDAFHQAHTLLSDLQARYLVIPPIAIAMLTMAMLLLPSSPTYRHSSRRSSPPPHSAATCVPIPRRPTSAAASTCPSTSSCACRRWADCSTLCSCHAARRSPPPPRRRRPQQGARVGRLCCRRRRRPPSARPPPSPWSRRCASASPPRCCSARCPLASSASRCRPLHDSASGSSRSRRPPPSPPSPRPPPRLPPLPPPPPPPQPPPPPAQRTVRARPRAGVRGIACSTSVCIST